MLRKYFGSLLVSTMVALVAATLAQFVWLPPVDSANSAVSLLPPPAPTEIAINIPAGVTEGQPFSLKIKATGISSETLFLLISEDGDSATGETREVYGTPPPTNATLEFQITPKQAGRLPLALTTVPRTALENGKRAEIPLMVAVNPSLFHRAWFFALVFAVALAVTFSLLLVAKKVTASRQQHLQKVEAKIEQAEIKAEKEPEKAKFAWDLARVKLEAYFDRNLLQVNQVFVVAIVVMCVGFGFVLCGVILAFKGLTQVSWVTAGSGIITQFIGATFMVIYRSTMAQANEFMTILERINSVGMAVQVLDSIPESEPQLKNETRAKIVELLLIANTTSRPKSDAARKKAKAAEAG